MAPEVIDRNYDQKCDIWSCGVIMYILLSGCPPFKGQNEKEILEKVRCGKYSLASEEWQMISSEAKSMIEKMLVKGRSHGIHFLDPSKRYSAQQALNDKWIQKYATKNEIEVPMLAKALNNMKNFRVREGIVWSVGGHEATRSGVDIHREQHDNAGGEAGTAAVV